MKKNYFLFFCMLFIFSSFLNAQTKFSYLEDADVSFPALPNGKALPAISALDNYLFPRVSVQVWGSDVVLTPEDASKYRVVTSDGTHINEAATLKATYSNVISIRYFSPMAYQAEEWSMPFLGSGPATDGINVYPGHWLYETGTTTKADLSIISTGNDTILLNNTTNFNPGDYVVIYDAPAGSFNNAEHMHVKDVNRSTGSIIVDERGIISGISNGPHSPRSHIAGSIIAAHEFDNSDNFLGRWSYNVSSVCPKDANGHTLLDVMADWLKNNLNRNVSGIIVKAYDGIIFDTDGWGVPPYMDVNNDLIPDGGMIGEENTWNTGLESFYAKLRHYYPKKLLSGGSPNSQGFSTLNGTQMEGLPTRRHLDYPPDYTILDELMQKYSTHMHHQGVGPVFCEIKCKTPTRLYDPAIAPDNDAFRLSFALTLMEDGYYNYGGYNHWWDEYAVDITSGSPTFGQAIASTPNNESAIRAHLGWLGKPLGPRYRIYDSATFSPDKSLLTEGNFETDINGWTVKQVGKNLYPISINQDATTSAEGSASLHASKMTIYSPATAGARILAPIIGLEANVQYTVCFAAKSSSFRQICLQLNNMQQQFYLTTNWTRYVACFTSTSTGSFNPTFFVGQQNTDVWIDAVYIFKGNSDLFRRDFDNGIAIANANPFPIQVNLGGTYQRIKGTGQDSINDGSTVTSVLIPGYDGAILMRPDSAFDKTRKKISSSQKSFIAKNTQPHSAWEQDSILLLLSPVPASHILNVTFKGINGKGEMDVINMSGQTLQKKSLELIKGVNKQQVDVSALISGNYILIIKANGQLLKGNFVKL